MLTILSLKREILVAALTAAATTLGTKLVELGIEAWQERNKPPEKSPLILPSGCEA